MMTRIKQWLAPPVFDNEKDNRTAYLLNVISFSYLIVLSGMTTLGVLQGGLSNINNETFVVLTNRVLPLFVTFFIAQILMRRGKLQIASYAYLILLWLSYVWGIWQYGGTEASTLANFVLIVLVAGLLIGNRGVAIFAGSSVFIILLTLILQNRGYIQTQEIPAVERVIAISLNLILSAVYLSLYIRSLNEALGTVETANILLEEAKGTLESRIAERTKDLELASEISRVLAQITNLENLLQESVETIREQFDFYYVQIYLADELASTLMLQAGTGNIGEELARKGHRLVIGPGSINGAAAAEKRAVIVSDTATNPLFRPNAFLPLTRSEMAVPLIIGNQVVGVLDLQSAKPNAFSTENLPAFEALAGQLAVAIENAKLLDAAAEARAEVESFSRRIAREGWSSYLDAVHRPQFLGYSYNAGKLSPLDAPISQSFDSKNVAQVSIDVIGESIGSIQIEADEERIWTANDLDLIQAIATQVGQQVEVLRALDDAAQYRQEAERALRKVTQEAWMIYEESSELAEGFAYNQSKIEPITAVSLDKDSQKLLHQDLSMHGEAVGELVVTNPAFVSEKQADELVTAVANQLVSHLENLRLSEQTEKALAESQKLGRELAIINQVVSRISNASGLEESMQIIVEELAEALNVNQVRVAMLDADQTKLTIVAEKLDLSLSQSVYGQERPVKEDPAFQEIYNSQKPLFIPDSQSSMLPKGLRKLLTEQQIQSLAVLPIIIDNAVIGTVNIEIIGNQKQTLTEEKIRLAESLVLQAATAIQKAQLFEETEARAEELAVINQVAQTVTRQIDRQDLVRSVHEQIQRIINVDVYYIALYDARTGLLEYPYIYENNHVFEIPHLQLSPGSSIYQALQAGKPILINRTQEQMDNLSENPEETFLDKVTASLIYIPLVTGYETLGVLSIQSYQMNAYNESHLTLMSGIANHVTVSLENTRLIENSQKTAEREQLLREISTTINTSIDAESILQTAAREIGRALGVDSYVYLTPDIVPSKPEPTPETNGGNGQSSNGEIN